MLTTAMMTEQRSVIANGGAPATSRAAARHAGCDDRPAVVVSKGKHKTVPFASLATRGALAACDALRSHVQLSVRDSDSIRQAPYPSPRNHSCCVLVLLRQGFTRRQHRRAVETASQAVTACENHCAMGRVVAVMSTPKQKSRRVVFSVWAVSVPYG